MGNLEILGAIVAVCILFCLFLEFVDAFPALFFIPMFLFLWYCVVKFLIFAWGEM